MNTSIPLLSAPHRAFFAVGATALVGLMCLWLMQLMLPGDVAIPAGWLHSWLMIHGVFAPFVFGFVFTAMPKWVNAAMPGRRLWVLTWFLYTVGLVVAVGAPLKSIAMSALGWLFVTLAWILVLTTVIRIWVQGKDGTVHSLPVLFAMTLGGLSAASILAWHLTNDWQWSFIGMRLGFWGFLFVLYVTVSHRMLPFFASCVVPGYTIRRPTLALVAFVAMGVTHMAIDLIHAFHLLWIPDAIMLALSLWLAWMWRWKPGVRNPLLTSLCVAWGSLSIGLALSTVQSLWLMFTGDFILGRAPMHWIGIGFFGSMLLAMATRVSRGHSGRPLVMPGLIWWCCLGLQLAALARTLADWPGLLNASRGMLLLSAAIWIVCTFLWSASHFPMYLKPRADGKPG